jgi:hypothetical protein
MIDKKLNKTAIIKEAKQILKNGTSRQETFEMLNQKYKNAKTVSDIIKNLPSSLAIKKYGLWNYTLLGLLILTATSLMLANPSIGTLLWYGLLIYAVAKMLVQYYIWVTILATIGIIGIVGILIINNTEPIKWTNLIIAFILMLIYLVLPIWIKNKLCPKPNEVKEKYTNSQGQLRLRIIYGFKD